MTLDRVSGAWMMSLAIVYAGALGAEDADQRRGGQMPGLDLMILVDQVEQVQLLALVLMQALGLDVEHCIRVNGDACVRCSQSASARLFCALTAENCCKISTFSV